MENISAQNTEIVETLRTHISEPIKDQSTSKSMPPSQQRKKEIETKEKGALQKPTMEKFLRLLHTTTGTPPRCTEILLHS